MKSCVVENKIVHKPKSYATKHVFVLYYAQKNVHKALAQRHYACAKHEKKYRDRVYYV